LFWFLLLVFGSEDNATHRASNRLIGFRSERFQRIIRDKYSIHSFPCHLFQMPHRSCTPSTAHPINCATIVSLKRRFLGSASQSPLSGSPQNVCGGQTEANRLPGACCPGLAQLGTRRADYVVVDGEFVTALFLPTVGDQSRARLKANLPELLAAAQKRLPSLPNLPFRVDRNGLSSETLTTSIRGTLCAARRYGLCSIESSRSRPRTD
jgi:hypothetical protein